MYKQFKPISNIKLYVFKFVNKNNIVCINSAKQISNIKLYVIKFVNKNNIVCLSS